MSDGVVSSSWAVDRFDEMRPQTEQAEGIVDDEDEPPVASASSRSPAGSGPAAPCCRRSKGRKGSGLASQVMYTRRKWRESLGVRCRT